MICAVSRSGSTYLCELLASTLALGNPNEYFNTAGRRRRMGPSYPADGFAQIDIIRTIGATSNGIYAVKVIGPQLARIASSIDPFRDLPNLSFVRIHRRDILGQAISLARARQTGRFITSDQQRGAPAYSQGQIRHAIQSIRQQEAIWDETMARLAAQPLVVAYEEILSDAQHVVDRIATHMGVAMPVPIDRTLITLSVQRDEQSVEWRERFLAEAGDEFRRLADR
jgi:LPS sulfotransferase NodH